MKNPVAESVDMYIETAEPEAKTTLVALRSIMQSAAPEAEEGISWGVPFYKYHGMLGGFSVFKKHATIGLAFELTPKAREELEAKGYKTGSKTVQVRFDQDVSNAVLSKIIKAKALANKAAASQAE